MVKELASFQLQSDVFSYDTLVREHGLDKNSELKNSLKSTDILITNNNLLDEFVLANNQEEKIFKLELAEGFLREDFSRMQNSNSSGIFEKLRQRKIDKIYQAREVIGKEKERVVMYFSPKGKNRSHIIGFAAGALFPVYQATNPDKKRLEKDSIIGEIPLVEWALGWQRQLENITG